MIIRFFTLLSLTLAANTFAATSLGFFGHPNYPGKCFINGLVLSAGEHRDPFIFCGKILCSSNGVAVFHSCSPILIKFPGCTMDGYMDTGLDYPDCCEPKLSCVD